MSLSRLFLIFFLFNVLCAPAAPALAQASKNKSSCRVPPSPAEAKVLDIAVTGYALAVSNVALNGQDTETGVTRIEIAKQAAPLYLVLSADSTMIWDIRGATEDISHVVVGGPHDMQGKILAGITNVPAEKVTFINKFDCLRGHILAFPQDKLPPYGHLKKIENSRILSEQIDSEGALTPNRENRITLPVAIAPRRKTEREPLRIYIGERVVFEKKQNLPFRAPPQGFDSRIWEKFLKDKPGGVIDLKNKTIVTPMTPEHYQFLPGWAGFGQMLMEKKIEIDEGRTASASFSMPHFRIMQEIDGLPALANGIRFSISLPLGVPPPKRKSRYGCIEAEETRTPIKGHCAAFDRENRPLTGTADVAPKPGFVRPLNHSALLVPEPYMRQIRDAVSLQKESTAHITPQPPRYFHAAAGEELAFAGWGDNGNGNLGRFSTPNISSPLMVWSDDFNRLISEKGTPVQFDKYPACLLLDTGAVWCVEGFLHERQPQENTLVLKKVEDLPAMKSIDAYGMHGSCGLDKDNQYWCWRIPKAHAARKYYPSWWRDNFSSDSPFPFIFEGMAQLQANAGQTCILTYKGAVWCWGEAYRNDDISYNKFSLAEDFPIPVPLAGTAISISSSDFASCAQMFDKTAQCWTPKLSPKPFTFFKNDRENQHADIVVKEIRVGGKTACALKDTDGSIWCTELSSMSDASPRYQQIKDIHGAPLLGMAELTNGTTICGIDKKRQLWCWSGDKADSTANEQPGIFASLMQAPDSNAPVRNVLFASTGYASVVALSRSKKTPYNTDVSTLFINAVFENRREAALTLSSTQGTAISLSPMMAHKGVSVSLHRNDPAILNAVCASYRAPWEETSTSKYLTDKLLKEGHLGISTSPKWETPPHPDIFLILLEHGLISGKTPGENTRILNILEKTYGNRTDAVSLLEKIRQIRLK